MTADCREGIRRLPSHQYKVINMPFRSWLSFLYGQRPSPHAIQPPSALYNQQHTLNRTKLSPPTGQRTPASSTQKRNRSTSRLSVSSVQCEADVQPQSTRFLVERDPRIAQDAVIFHDQAYYWLRMFAGDPPRPLLYLEPSGHLDEPGSLSLLPYSETSKKLLLEKTSHIYESTCRVVEKPPISQWNAYGLSGGVASSATGSSLKLPENYIKRKEGGLLFKTFWDGWYHIPGARLDSGLEDRQVSPLQGPTEIRWDPACVYIARPLNMKPVPDKIGTVLKRKTTSVTIDRHVRKPLKVQQRKPLPVLAELPE